MPGRPATGKKAYCIRMKPDTNADLQRAAKTAGYSQVGDWLATLVQDKGEESLEEMTQAEIDRALRLKCVEVCNALEAVLDVLCCEPSSSAENSRSFDYVRSRYRHVANFALRACKL